MRKAIEHILVHWGRYGIRRGTKILRLRAKRTHSLHKLDSPVTGQEVLVRAGGSDMAIYHEVILEPYLPVFDLAEDAVVLDLGANIGLATNLFRSQYPKSKIIAVEPDPDNFDLLMKNTAGLGNVTCIQAAICPRKMMIEMDREGKNSSGFQTKESDGGSIEGMTIDSILEQEGVQRVGLLKLDIEGAEKELFEDGGKDWIAKCDNIAVELHDRIKPGCGTAFFNAIDPDEWDFEISGQMNLISRKKS